jgi:hypothetical protein
MRPARLMGVLGAMLLAAAPGTAVRAQSGQGYSAAACTQNPSLPGCPENNGGTAPTNVGPGNPKMKPGHPLAGTASAFANAASKAASAAGNLRACRASGGNCTTLARTYAAAVHRAQTLARRLGVPYTAPATGGGGTSGSITGLSSGYSYANQVAAGMTAIRSLPDTGGGQGEEWQAGAGTK